MNANLQRPRTPVQSTAIADSNINMPSDPCNDIAKTFNIPLIDDIIEDLVLFSQQLLLPRVIKADNNDAIEISDQNKDTNNNNESNLREIDVEVGCYNAKRAPRHNEEYESVVVEESDTTTIVNIENEKINDNNVMNDEEYEKWFNINNAGLAVALPFVVSIY